MNKLNIIYKNIADLVPYAQNSRTHSDEQIEQKAVHAETGLEFDS